jgi:4-hydroxy-4-methyl-2-oxoglutarate aldolase
MKTDLLDEIVDYIEKNRVSTTEVADALNKKGVLDGIKILNPGHFVTGKINYVYAYNESNWPLHEQIQSVEEGSIVYVDTFNCNNRAVFGDLVMKYLILYRKVKGVVVEGYLRDAHRLRKENYPIWCRGVTPLGCFNHETSLDEEMKQAIEDRKKLFTNAIMVCDDSGCTMVENRLLNKDFIKRVDFIELQEDIWYFCIDTLKMSTFETVCLKKYIDKNSRLSDRIKEKIAGLKKDNYIK